MCHCAAAAAAVTARGRAGGTGALPEAQRKDGATALDAALHGGHDEVAALLLSEAEYAGDSGAGGGTDGR